MAASDLVLAEPPVGARALDLWLQHGVAKILFEDVRGYALRMVDPAASDEARDVAAKAVDDAMYGLMQVLDGVTGALAGNGRLLRLQANAVLEDRDTMEELARLKVDEGDGMCIGFWGWLEGDFGEEPVVES